MHTALRDGDTASGDTFPQIALKLVEDAKFLCEKIIEIQTNPIVKIVLL